MTVKELIGVLETFPPDEEIFIHEWDEDGSTGRVNTPIVGYHAPFLPDDEMLMIR